MRARLKKSDTLPITVAVSYFLLIHWSMGLRVEHLLLIGFLMTCYFVHAKGRRFVIDFLPIALFGMLYDFLRIYPKSWAGPIHVVWPYELEKSLFGVMDKGRTIIPCEFFLDRHWALVDLVTGAAYSLHVLVPLAFAFVVWVKRPAVARSFNWAFFAVNVLAFATYIAFPAAPPWYVRQYGFGPADWSLPSSPAGLERFDALLGMPYFAGVYAKNAWVFGAIPSMHAGFPFLVLCYAARFLKRAVLPITAFMLLIWFSAVYLQHHYVIDLIAGVLYVSVVVSLAWAKPMIVKIRGRSRSPSDDSHRVTDTKLSL